MSRIAAIAAGFALVATAPLSPQTTPPPPAAAPKLPELNAEQKAELTCSAIFAITASEQASGEEAALRYPALKARGREYFVRFGAKTMDATGASREAVKALLENEVLRLQKFAQALGDPDAAMGQTLGPCLPRLDAAVPPLPKPTLGQCTAIMQLAFEEVYARTGLNNSQAKDLKILASVLEDRQRKALELQGVRKDEADRRLSEEHDRMLKEAVANGPGVEKYDLDTCYAFAKPDPAKHY